MKKTTTKCSATTATKRNATKSVSSGANILLIDIETSPLLGWAWQKYDATLRHIEKDWQLLSFAYKWAGNASTVVRSQRTRTEKELVEDVWGLLDKAHIVVAHNGDRFDVKKLQAKMAEYHMEPPSPFKTVDTLRIAKNHFAFTSNKLDDLGQKLSLGRKLDTGGFKLWLDVMNGDQAAWMQMEKYNKQDVVLLEKLYTKLRPWMPRHPNMAVYSNTKEPVCSACGSTHVEEVTNKYYTNSSAFRKYMCLDCGAWSRLRKADGAIRPSTIMCDRK